MSKVDKVYIWCIMNETAHQMKYTVLAILFLLLLSCSKKITEKQTDRAEEADITQLILQDSIITAAKEYIHPSVNTWTQLIYHLESAQYTIHVDKVNGAIRYVSWEKPKTIAEQPELILLDSIKEGYQGKDNRNYSFSDQSWTYVIEEITQCKNQSDCGIFLSIYKDGQLNLSQKMTTTDLNNLPEKNRLISTQLIGKWKDTPAVYKDKGNQYNFSADGGYHYHYDQSIPGQRNISQEGTWAINNAGDLELAILNKSTLVGGTATASGEIINGELSTQYFQVPAKSSVSLRDGSHPKHDQRRTIIIDEKQYWQVSSGK